MLQVASDLVGENNRHDGGKAETARSSEPRTKVTRVAGKCLANEA